MMKSSLIFLTLFLTFVISTMGQPERAGRQRRDVTCAVAGHKGCNLSCKARGWKDGSCAWNTETGAFNCECDKEKRGVRCNLGGPNTCHYSCVALGYASGECDANFDCNCGGGNNRWGDVIDNVRDRL